MIRCAARWALVALVLSVGFAARADFEAGRTAWEAGRKAEAMEAWRTAAEEGDGRAMLALGRRHAEGVGVLQDYVEAHLWLNLAASRGEAEAPAERDALAEKMSEEQVAEAQARAAVWLVQRTLPAAVKAEEKPVEAAEMAEPEKATPPARAETDSSPAEPAQGAEPSPAMTALERVLVQLALAALGHDVGAADGVFGRRTRDGIVGWQESQGEAVTGWLTAAQLEALLAHGREVQAEREAHATPASATETGSAAAPDRAGAVFRDCADCPEMVVVPAGSFTMGSPESEKGHSKDEGPTHRVTIPSPFAVGKHEVTRGEFGRFMAATGHSTGDSCNTWESSKWKERSGRGWRNPGFSQTDRDPVVCVNWEDAQAYVRWLSKKTGMAYRLLSEAEWEYAARAGTRTARFWGESESGQCQNANGADSSSGVDWAVSCTDGYAKTAPVGSFTANAFGLHDVLGNVWEWVEDCWNENYEGAPSDGSAWRSGDCSNRGIRGGSWLRGPVFQRSAGRSGSFTDDRFCDDGFRVARTLDP